MRKPAGSADEWGQGRIQQWDAAKGLGFVQPDAGSDRLLLRRADLTGRMRTRQPHVGEPVRFLVSGAGAQRRAARVSTLLPPPAPPAPTKAPVRGPNSARLLVIPAFALVLGGIQMNWPLPRIVPMLYSALSMALFVVYGMDKWAARKGQARVRESVLHGLALFGGWPGALLGQQIFRHKTAQPRFLRITWGMVAINLTALLVIFTPLLSPLFPR